MWSGIASTACPSCAATGRATASKGGVTCSTSGDVVLPVDVAPLLEPTPPVLLTAAHRIAPQAPSFNRVPYTHGGGTATVPFGTHCRGVGPPL